MSSDTLHQDNINQILKGISIPPQPQLMVDLQMEQLEPDCSVESIARLIRQDIGLSGMILKTINSPFFKRRSKVSSINHAISLLGIDTVISIVNSISIRGALSNEEITQMTQFWDSSMDIAGACVLIAKHTSLVDPDDAYSLGLFHNCGNILMLQRFPQFPKVLVESYKDHPPRVTDVENIHFKTNHAVVGYYVSKAWRLPKHISNAIAQHHSIENVFGKTSTATEEEKNLLVILKLAEHFCGIYRVLGNQQEDLEWQKIQSIVLGHAGVTEFELESMHSQIEDMGLASSSYIQFP
jgi:HD-like signal output (HDOD) protein